MYMARSNGIGMGEEAIIGRNVCGVRDVCYWCWLAGRSGWVYDCCVLKGVAGGESLVACYRALRGKLH